ncbi:MAG: glycosyltransferase [Candidatus Hydrogenedentota bacterium]|uniref:Putative glycosyl transferase n=1 Tax=Sumerlaea chitinivorans TaxID=2250252 RepID=A0A2Z4Y4A9_SUMC1|nr:putative glycosyl transferase [Candidatus Sumerlaea chitinivorans]RMH27591.1 MAG: glycosyltransferase [Candidatus Hydrogenedentota bacterium]
MELAVVPSLPEIQLSIIILTRNRLDILRECIAALLPHTAPGDEILICDTGSNDGTVAWLSTLPPPVRFTVVPDSKADFATARNFAVQEAKGSWIAFTDDDCIPAHDWIARIKHNLTHFQAVGGPVLPGKLYAYPRWWSGEFAWTIGMSPRGLVRRQDDCYPATANLAAHRHLFEMLPFAPMPTSMGPDEQYLAGREDAQWWFEARRRGWRLHIDLRQIVFHKVPAERILWRYVIRRAEMDGAAAGKRFPNKEIARHAAIEGSRIATQLWLRPWQWMSKPAQCSEQYVWATRQLALAKHATAAQATSKERLDSLIVEGVCRALRHEVGVIRLRAKRAFRPKLAIPDPPRHLLIAAPTYLGDTVLLQPVVRLLAETWPHANIVVWTAFPEILRTTDPRIQIISTDPANEAEVQRYALCASQLNFVPYYHFGSRNLWRNILSTRGITFDTDVGFSKVSDYFLSAHRVHKRFDVHEHLNLLNLVSLWPLVGELQPPRLSPDPEVWEQLTSVYPQLRGQRFATLHVDTALEMKRWPVERWAYLGKICRDKLRLHSVFIGNLQASDIAEELVKELGHEHATNACGISLTQLISLIAHAKLAIGPCSGPKHIAYACQTPTFTLYGAVSETRWGAWFDRELHGFIRSPIQYLSPLEQTGLPENYAMLLISAEEAGEALLKHARKLGVSR